MGETIRTDDEAFDEQGSIDKFSLDRKSSSEAQRAQIKADIIRRLLDMDPQRVLDIVNQYPELGQVFGKIGLLRESGEQGYRSNEGDQ